MFAFFSLLSFLSEMVAVLHSRDTAVSTSSTAICTVIQGIHGAHRCHAFRCPAVGDSRMQVFRRRSQHLCGSALHLFNVDPCRAEDWLASTAPTYCRLRPRGPTHPRGIAWLWPLHGVRVSQMARYNSTGENPISFVFLLTQRNIGFLPPLISTPITTPLPIAVEMMIV